MTTLVNLSLELIDRILFALDPLDVARFSQTSRFFHEIIYGPLDRQFWRGLYLAQALDDPRRTTDHLGTPRKDEEVDWKGELQRIVRARTVIERPDVCPPEERCEVLRTCINLLTHLPPLSSSSGLGQGELSRNVQWMHRLLADRAFLDHARVEWVLRGEKEEEEEGEGDEAQLVAKLHTLVGLTKRDYDPEQRRAAQAFVYSLRNCTEARSYGPFLPGQVRIDWEFIWMLVYDLGVLLLDADDDGEDEDEEDESPFFCPLSLLYRQSIIPRGVNLDKEDDWAWVEGLWSVRYGFMDHREFILYNDPSVPEDEPQDVSIFDGTEELLASLDIYFRVASIEPDPSNPTRPKINVVGEVDGKFNMVGFIKLTDDNQVWWHYTAGNDNQMVWYCDAISLGNVRSRCGFIGVWSTVFHDVDDPIGAFWLQREILPDDDDD